MAYELQDEDEDRDGDFTEDEAKNYAMQPGVMRHHVKAKYFAYLMDADKNGSISHDGKLGSVARSVMDRTRVL